jgi:hypothetical protein
MILKEKVLLGLTMRGKTWEEVLLNLTSRTKTFNNLAKKVLRNTMTIDYEEEEDWPGAKMNKMNKMNKIVMKV